MATKSAPTGGADLLDTLGDFTSRENWDKFFALRGTGDSFEWYAEWPPLEAPLLELLHGSCAGEAAEILVPGCGSSALSEQLYDAGFRRITNVDFSRIVVADMLRRHARARPEMRWRVMDMTDMQAKRVLRSGGKFVCLTLAESHVLALLLSEFRFGWEMNIQAIPSKKSAFQTFMVVMVKGKMGVVQTIKSSLDQSTDYCNVKQANAVIRALGNENIIRESYSSGVDLGSSLFCYKAVLLDSKKQTETFVYHCGVFIVPKGFCVHLNIGQLIFPAKIGTITGITSSAFPLSLARTQEWLFASEEGQWHVVESAKAARLIMVFLDSRHASADMDIIKKDLSPLVKDLEPGNPEEEAPIPFMMAGDGVKQREILQEVTSEITGPMVVEDVVYENVNGDQSSTSEKMFRRLIFKRSSGLVQSEALLIRDSPSDEMDKKNKSASATSKKRRNQKKGSKNSLRINHSYLGSSYHSSIISGLSLVASALSAAAASGVKISTTVIGLGAGCFPMFFRGCLPFVDIEVVELDPMVAELAKKYFGFSVDEQLKVHLGDGIKFVEDIAAAKHGAATHSVSNGSDNNGVNILIVDVDSSDLSSGLSCPPVNFVEDSFLLSAKQFLSEGGLFIINLVSRSPSVRDMVISRLKAVFEHLYSMQLDEDVNEVLFASPSKRYLETDHLDAAVTKLKDLLKFPVDVESDIKKLQKLQ
ncbi:hypothetical protein PR202_ga20598 [Eleusine coracana subsp. coracana]|uniref:Methyltransferase type 11 domain-containing protein n=1 Tax=Eleusine coracana subsp. coracana TaxID=191504 RepID=A0AAV5CYR4_ELECO|nr:hypothetical protein PR202_ga20598 [Eleusine coracana subsp. coracana]